MSTFLQLSVLARAECQMTGTGPTTVTGQLGRLGDIVRWTSQSYTELQNKRTDWRWMRSSFTLNTVAGTASYAYASCIDTITSAAISRFREWKWFDTDGTPVFKIYKQSEGIGSQTYLGLMGWGEFRAVYQTGTVNSTRPISIAIDPQNNLVLGPTPDAVYVVSGDYQRSAQVLAVDADTPEMPSEYHMLIAYRAMRKYASRLNAPEIMSGARSEEKALLQELIRTQVPRIARARPLA